MLDRNNIKEILLQLDEISKDYKHFEVALLIFLRSDLFQFENYITEVEIERINDLVKSESSILDIDKEEIDRIIYNCDEDEEK